ncbi:type VI immunity family protein [Archangium violaceum]|uniref:type VI immunity family protein n=1 Tax=Archangium violaceum TaxID=83451 RepID=UPI0036D81C72
MTPNPLYVPSPNPAVQVPLAELKQHLLLFVESPPGPKTARAVYDLYQATWGDRFTTYSSTAFGTISRDWSQAARQRFESQELPDLRKHEHWGYSFSDGRASDSWLFMFHGYRPALEPGKASFYRFEFDWQLEPARLLEFTEAVLSIVRCVSGYAGYMFQGQPLGPFGKNSFDQIYAWARRYWAVDVEDLDVTVNHMLDGYKCPSWLTVIGERLEGRNPAAVSEAASAAFRSLRTPGGVLLQAGLKQTRGDQNRKEPLDGYVAIARALEPLQVQQHGTFGGSRWDESRTMAWLRRFTAPGGWSATP